MGADGRARRDDRSADSRGEGGWQVPVDHVKGRATLVFFSRGDNVANLNTPGFKGAQLQFADHFYKDLDANGGLGTTTFEANSLLYARAQNTIGEILSSNPGLILQLDGSGVPTWVSTTSLGINFGSLTGSLVGIAAMIRQGRGGQTRIPFGPFLAVGAISYLFLQDHILALWHAYLVRAGL